MNLDLLRESGKIIAEYVRGSHAYGTALSTSDKDIGGIFTYSLQETLSLFPLPQEVSDGRHDTCFYSMQKFFELAIKGNPNILEALWIPEDCVVVSTPKFLELTKNRHLFITKSCYDAHIGYAYAQIQKAKGQNKWINNPSPEAPPDKKDFCWVIASSLKTEFPSRPVPLKQTPINLDQLRCAGLEHTENTYRLYTCPWNDKDNSAGVFKGPNQQLVTQSISKEDENVCFVGLLIFNEQAYEKARRDWKNYWEWVKWRNPSRWTLQEKGETDYDVKNMYHCIRLLWSGRNILEFREPIIRVSGDRLKILMDIRLGKYTYDEIMKMVEEEMSVVRELEKKIKLPNSVNPKKVNELYQELLLCSSKQTPSILRRMKELGNNLVWKLRLS